LVEAAVWWLAVELIGLAAFPITFAVLRFLPDRGYSVTKVVGLVLMTYLLWLGGTVHLVPNQRLSILGILALITAVSIVLAWRNRAEISGFLGQRWANLVFADAVFTATFVVCLTLRALSGDSLSGGNDNRWQMAFVNIILRSDYFPPEDPWLSGYSINYYYFGFVIVAALTKLTSIASEITFNLTIAVMPALAVSGMFGIVYNSLIDRGKPALVLACVQLAFDLRSSCQRLRTAVSTLGCAMPPSMPTAMALARLPSTETLSPIFMVLRVQPWRIRPFGLPISIAQFVTFFVFSSTTSM